MTENLTHAELVRIHQELVRANNMLRDMQEQLQSMARACNAKVQPAEITDFGAGTETSEV